MSGWCAQTVWWTKCLVHSLDNRETLHRASFIICLLPCTIMQYTFHNICNDYCIPCTWPSTLVLHQSLHVDEKIIFLGTFCSIGCFHLDGGDDDRDARGDDDEQDVDKLGKSWELIAGWKPPLVSQPQGKSVRGASSNHQRRHHHHHHHVNHNHHVIEVWLSQDLA